MIYPILTTADDVEQLVAYLRTKPTGADIQSVASTLGSRYTDGRKLTAYESWGVVRRDGSKLSLTEEGWALARGSKTRQALFADVIRKLHCYLAATEFMQFQGLSSITNVDVAALWHERYADEIGTVSENTLKDMSVCFFHVCEAAALGELKLGRRGLPTRLEINRSSLSQFIEGTDHSGDVLAKSSDTPLATVDLPQEREGHQGGPAHDTFAGQQLSEAQSVMRVFIAHGSNKEIVGQLKDILELSDLPFEVAMEAETTAVPVPLKVLESMRNCTAAIIAITADENRQDGKGQYVLNENVLIEIGAAFVLYDTNVVLVWDQRLAVPSNLQGLYRCDFEGDLLDTTAFTRLMKALKKMRHQRLLDPEPKN